MKSRRHRAIDKANNSLPRVFCKYKKHIKKDILKRKKIDRLSYYYYELIAWKVFNK